MGLILSRLPGVRCRRGETLWVDEIVAREDVGEMEYESRVGFGSDLLTCRLHRVPGPSGASS